MEKKFECSCMDVGGCEVALHIEVSNHVKLGLIDGHEMLNIILTKEQALELSKDLAKVAG